MLICPRVGFSGLNVSWGYQTPIPRICNCPFVWKKDLCKCDKDTEVGRIPHVRWALNTSTCVLTRGRQEAVRDAHREDCIKMGAETGRMQPHAQECPRPPAAQRGRCAPERAQLPTPWFLPSGADFPNFWPPENKFLLFRVTKFVTVCYGSHRKPIQRQMI